MSVAMQVFVSDTRMPSAHAWADAIRAHGFEMELDAEFDVREFAGFLPCKYQGRDAGFEYFYEPVAGAGELDGRLRDAIGNRDRVVSFVTHSDFRELMTSIIAAGVLCASTDGILWDTEADELTCASAAIEWSRRGERDIAPELDGEQ